MWRKLAYLRRTRSKGYAETSASRQIYTARIICKHECYTFIFVKFTNTCLPVLIGHEKSVLQQMQQRNIPGPHRSSEK